jgi:preprotein translocase subunit SecE
MNTRAADETVQVFDLVKRVSSVIIVVTGVAAFYYFSDWALLHRVITLVTLVSIAVGIFLSSKLGQVVWQFVLESKQEVRRVVWPTRDETMRTTGLVALMVVLVGILLSLLDAFLLWGIRLLTGQV